MFFSGTIAAPLRKQTTASATARSSASPGATAIVVVEKLECHESGSFPTVTSEDVIKGVTDSQYGTDGAKQLPEPRTVKSKSGEIS